MSLWDYEKLKQEIGLTGVEAVMQGKILHMLESTSGVFSTGKSDIG